MDSTFAEKSKFRMRKTPYAEKGPKEGAELHADGT